MPTKAYMDEDTAIEWQMLMALFISNKITNKVMSDNLIKYIALKSIKATEYLMGDHAADFRIPSRRRKNLKAFISKVNAYLKSINVVIGI